MRLLCQVMDCRGRNPRVAAGAENSFLDGYLGRLGDLGGATDLLVDALDDTDGNGLPHVTDGEATCGGERSEDPVRQLFYNTLTLV